MVADPPLVGVPAEAVFVPEMRPKALECGGKTARHRSVILQSGATARHSKALRAPKSKRWFFMRLGAPLRTELGLRHREFRDTN